MNFRRSSSRAFRLSVLATLVLVLSGVSIVSTQLRGAAATRAFAIRPIPGPQVKAQFTDTGDIVFVSNTLMSCATAATTPSCSAARAGTSTGTAAINNGNFMTYVDADGVGSTFDSSRADLAVPTGGVVLFAGLYWGAKTTAGAAANGQPAGAAATNPALVNQVKFATAAGSTLTSPGTYNLITSNTTGVAGSTDLDPGGVVSSAYSGYADVTALVQAGGSGSYWVADVQAATGPDRYAGWTLVVAYRDPTQPLRQLTVFDGFGYVANGSPSSITINGFQAPPAGPVNGKVGLVAFEGDKTTTGDAFQLNGTTITDGQNPANDFFNSSISNTGNRVTSKFPDYVNQLGYDADIVNANGLIAPSATSATLNLSSTGDVYYPQVVTTVIDVYAPKFPPVAGLNKTVTDVNGGSVEPGDILRYDITVTNTGQDGAIAAVLTDAIPTNTTYVANSLVIASGANAGIKTDPATDDQAEYSTSPSPKVVFRLGVGADATNGGAIAPAASTSLNFQVRVDAATPHGTAITNQASFAYTGQTSGVSASAMSPQVTSSVVYASDLTIAKSHSGTIVPGLTSSFSLAVTNNGPSVNPGPITINDMLPATLTFVPAGSGGNGWSCSAIGQAVTCTLPGPLPIGAAPAATIVTAVSPAASGTISNTASVTSAMTDPTPGNNSSTDTGSAGSSADITLTKNHTGAVVAGQSVTYSLTVGNPTGPGAANGPLTITDSVPAGLTFVAVSGSGWSCSPAAAIGPATLTCTNASALPVGSTSSMDLTFSVASAKTGSITNSASVTSASADPTPANNTATDGPTPIVVAADLAVTKTHSGAITAGQNATYTVVVSNAGPSDAAGPISVTDTLVSGLAFVSSPTAGWSCSAAGQAVTCSRAPGLVVGTSASLDLIVAVAPDATGSLSNTASASSPTSDPDATNNSGTDNGAITVNADLSLTKTHSGSFVAGESATYVLTVRNAGPATAAGPLTIVDSLPAGVTVTASSPGWSCSPVNGVTTCTNPSSLAPLASSTLSLTVSLASDLTAAVTNSATVSSSTTDLNPSDNSATDGPTPVATRADLAVSKSHIGSIIAGQNATYTVAIANAGPSDAAGPITVNDTLPSAMTFVWTTTAGWSCSASGSNVTCTSSSPIPAGATTSVDLVVSVASGASGPITNSANASSPTSDPNPLDNTASDSATVTNIADLDVAKTHSGPIVAGSDITWNLALHNSGPSVAAASVSNPVVVTDTLPAGATFVSGFGSGWSCTAVGQLVTCQLSSPIANGATSSVVIGASISASLPAGTDVTNAASITSSPAPDPDGTNNTATDPATSEAAADLSLTKAHSGSIVAGATVTYTIGVHNAGPSAASGPITVADTLPAWVSFVSASGSGWTCTNTGQNVTCDRATLAANADAAFTFVVSVDPAATGTLDNSATVSSPTPDPNSTNNTSDDIGTISSSADLRITKTVSPVLVAGSNSVYTIRVTNNGPSTAVNLTITDVIPVGLTLDGAPTGAGWTCSVSAGVVTCTRPSLNPLAFSDVTIPVVVDPSATGPIPNTATVSATTSDPFPSDNSSTNPGTVGVNADLSITKTHPAGPLVAGWNTAYTITVVNAGPSSAANATITDTLPSGLSFVSAAGGGWTCSGLSTVTCTHGPLASGTSAAVDVTVAVSAMATAGPADNSASVASTTPEPNPIDNATNDPGTIVAIADLSTYKSHVGSLTAGQNTMYSIVVTNAGPSQAAGPVTITDTLPAGLIFVSTPSSGWTCSAAGQDITCVRAAMAPATASQVDLLVSVSSSATGSVTNTATVSSATPDPDSSNDASSDGPDPIATLADLSITKTHTGPLVAGGTVTYTIGVHNAGPSDSSNIAISDPLPSGFTLISASGAGWVCTPSSGAGTIACLHGTLVAGGDASIVFDVALGASVPAGSGDNSVTVVSSTADPVAANNSATDNATITNSADLSITKVAGPGPYVAGAPITWIVTVTNAGPSDATSVAVTDAAPAGVTAFSATSAQGPCDATISCTLGTVGAGATAMVVVSGTIDASYATGPLANTATVSSPTSDPDLADRTATSNVSVVANADLTITKSASPSPVISGNVITWTLAVHNNGPSNAVAVQVADSLPTGILSVTATSGQGTCTPTGSCSLGSVAANASVIITISATVDANRSGSLDNQATVSSTTPDATPANDSASVSTPIVSVSDLAVTKTGPSGDVIPGTAVSWTIVVSNNGPSAAGSVVMSDPLPAGLIGATATSTQGSCTVTASAVTCAIGIVTVGQTVTITIDATLASGFLDPNLINTASVTGAVLDPVAGNNSSGVSTPSSPITDVTVTVALSTTALLAGQPLDLTITVANAGPSDAVATMVSFSVPAGYEIFDSSGAPCDVVAGIATCPLGTVVAGAGGVRTIVVHGRVASGFQGDSLSFPLEVSTLSSETNIVNNDAVGGSSVSRQAVLDVTKVASADTALYGEHLTYTLALHNAGPSDATSAILEDDVPPELAIASVVSDNSACTVTGQHVSCQVASLTAGQTITATLDAAIVATGYVNNRATGGSQTPGGPDPVVADTSVLVPHRAELEVTKTVDDPAPNVGDYVTWTIVVTNHGPDAAANVVVDEPLSYAIWHIKSEASQGSYNWRNALWLVGDLPSGATATLSIVTSVRVPGIIVNRITVTDDLMSGAGIAPIAVEASIYSRGSYSLPITGADTMKLWWLAALATAAGALLLTIGRRHGARGQANV